MLSILNPVQSNERYQPHIDGLRAIAVIAVLFFHYAPSKLQSGFIGVDVFFVISGYLITGILYRSYQKNNFLYTITKFYQHRIRRIFPAVLLVLLFLFIIGWLSLFSNEFKALLKHIAASTAFIENFVLYFESGYFDTDSIEKPLLHFWSLAVEEQFYIFWPIALYYLVCKDKIILKFLAFIIISSFLVNLISVYYISESFSFYLPFTRIWELLIGAWLSIAQAKQVDYINKNRGLQNWVGIVLILLGFMFTSPASRFPGFIAILPVFGSALIINAGNHSFINRYILSNKIAVFIGLISFPLYLWHWVLISISAILFKKRLPGISWANTKIILALISILLAYLTYKLIETPIRKNGKTLAAIVLAVLMLFVGAISFVLITKDGIQHRPYSLINNSDLSQKYMNSMDRTSLENICFNQNKKSSLIGDTLPDDFYCILGDNNSDVSIAAYGDSHSLSMIPVLDRYGKENNIKVFYSGIDSCLPFIGIKYKYDKSAACQELAIKMPEIAEKNSVKVVIFIQSWNGYLRSDMSFIPDNSLNGVYAFIAGLDRTTKLYDSIGINIVLMTDNPSQSISPPVDQIRFSNSINIDEINSLSIGIDSYKKQQEKINDILRDKLSDHANMYLLDVSDNYCNQIICPLVNIDGFLYYDKGHLSTLGAMQSYNMVSTYLNNLLIN